MRERDRERSKVSGHKHVENNEWKKAYQKDKQSGVRCGRREE